MRQKMASILVMLGVVGLCGCGSQSGTTQDMSTQGDGGPNTVTFVGEAWADNWFALYFEEQLIAQDSVPITTERSFNAETFTFAGTYPMVLSFVLKDYKADDSGLEYIGLPNQQIGDGGFSFQLTDKNQGKVVAVSNKNWRCKVIHRAPLNPTCVKDAEPIKTCQFQSEAEPIGWRATTFDDSSWVPATEHTAAAVGPKDGYLQIKWDPSAKLIWSSDLKTDKTLLCRVRI